MKLFVLAAIILIAAKAIEPIASSPLNEDFKSSLRQKRQSDDQDGSQDYPTSTEEPIATLRRYKMVEKFDPKKHHSERFFEFDSVENQWKLLSNGRRFKPEDEDRDLLHEGIASPEPNQRAKITDFLQLRTKPIVHEHDPVTVVRTRTYVPAHQRMPMRRTESNFVYNKAKNKWFNQKGKQPTREEYRLLQEADCTYNPKDGYRIRMVNDVEGSPDVKVPSIVRQFMRESGKLMDESELEEIRKKLPYRGTAEEYARMRNLLHTATTTTIGSVESDQSSEKSQTTEQNVETTQQTIPQKWTMNTEDDSGTTPSDDTLRMLSKDKPED